MVSSDLGIFIEVLSSHVMYKRFLIQETDRLEIIWSKNMKKEDWKEECKKYIKERGYIIRPNKSVYIHDIMNIIHEIIDFGYKEDTIILYDIRIDDNEIIGCGVRTYITDYNTFKEEINKIIKKYKELQIKLKRKEIEHDFE